MTDPTTAGADHLLALLAVVADPATHKARLDELVAQQKAIDEKTAVLNEMAADTRRQNTAAIAATIVLNNRKAALDAREAELNDKARGHEQATSAQKQAAQHTEQKLRQREADLARREAALQARETTVKDMESTAAKARDDAETLKRKLQRQAAAVNVALTT